MRHERSPRLRAKPAWPRKLPSAIKLQKPRVCSANGSGTEPSGLCAKCTTGRAAPSGPRLLNVPRKHNLCPRVWTGSSGWGPLPSAHSTTRIYPSFGGAGPILAAARSEEHTSELQSHSDLVCRLLLEKKKEQVSNT